MERLPDLYVDGRVGLDRGCALTRKQGTQDRKDGFKNLALAWMDATQVLRYPDVHLGTLLPLSSEYLLLDLLSPGNRRSAATLDVLCRKVRQNLSGVYPNPVRMP